MERTELRKVDLTCAITKLVIVTVVQLGVKTLRTVQLRILDSDAPFRSQMWNSKHCGSPSVHNNSHMHFIPPLLSH